MANNVISFLASLTSVNNIQLHFERKRLPGLLSNARRHCRDGCRAFWWHVERRKTSCFELRAGKGRGVSGVHFVHERRWCIQMPVGLHDMAGLSNLEKMTWIKFH